MSNHVHCILSAQHHNLSDIIRDFKSFTSKQMLQSIEQEPESRREWMMFQFKRAAQQHLRNKRFQIWTHENHAIQLDNNEMIDQRLEYIHNNPVEAGYVHQPEHYIYSSAGDYSDCKGLGYFSNDLTWVATGYIKQKRRCNLRLVER